MPAKINKNKNNYNYKTRKTKNNKKTRKFQKGGAQASASARKLTLPIAPRKLPLTPEQKKEAQKDALIKAVKKANNEDYNSAVALLLKEYTFEALQTLQLSFKLKNGTIIDETEGQYKNRSNYYKILGYLYSLELTESKEKRHNHTYQNIANIPPIPIPRPKSTSISSDSSGVCSLDDNRTYEYCNIENLDTIMKASSGSSASCNLNDEDTYQYCTSEYLDNLIKKLNATKSNQSNTNNTNNTNNMSFLGKSSIV